jgi:1,4-dihydroxy-6-naphthoate synthase
VVLWVALDAGPPHHDEALDYAREFGRGLDVETADRFVAMYVNERTRDMGDSGRAAVAELLRRAGTSVAAEFVP